MTARGPRTTQRFWRETTVIGLPRGSHSYAPSHPFGCQCESCGPLLLLALSEYEAHRLQEALEKRDGHDSGDWHGQLRMKLAEALGSWHPAEDHEWPGGRKSESVDE